MGMVEETTVDVERFVTEGFLKVEEAFPRSVGDRIRESLWERMGLSPDRPSEWTKPVIWVTDETGQGPFGEAARSPRLTAALNQIAGEGAWYPRGSVGMMPIRFPHPEDAGDTGWHIDQNHPGPDNAWGIISARPRTMLVLLLYSEVTEQDAPTRIRVGSHLETARVLEPYGERGLPFQETGPIMDAAGADRPLALATGLPGDAYLCHPFLVHAAQPHHGTRPRFMSQIPFSLVESLSAGESTPLARAVRLGLSGA
ncbi:phytanoyl-CoA dioxygenase family protein [Planotetraspora phitsanulokensis]|uniref:Phytanoyl-CoA dioxygenase n=1 Tax=Planotetraspora phitsanulokensis TaxID=575192 RepID=A0A8J3UAU4_9ACTN|nr:phytanoyl-CoA dioxygenase family protein [Planotetraspora phitsanulokensis]GII41964.1 phytanoyl-CoA dioxygenase [Planotetraspora phitsanulokensis]